MMATKDLIKKVHENSKEIASKGSEVVEKAYKTTANIISQAKQDGPELITNLVKKGESEWDEARKVIDKLFKDNSDKLKNIQQDILKSLEELRDKIVKGLPIDITLLQDLLKKIEDKIGTLDLPFIKLPFKAEKLPLEGYDKMTVRTVLPKLSKLTKEQLENILKYEEKHQNRVSITREIKKILK